MTDILKDLQKALESEDILFLSECILKCRRKAENAKNSAFRHFWLDKMFQFQNRITSLNTKGKEDDG